MKYCSECGKELGAGVTRCWNPDCGAEFLAPVIPTSPASPVQKSVKLRELELEYDLARRGLAAGTPKTYVAMLSGFSSLVVSALVLGFTGKLILGGWQLVAVFGIIAVAIVVYNSFVFGRVFKLKGEIAKEKKRLEIEAGKSIR